MYRDKQKYIVEYWEWKSNHYYSAIDDPITREIIYYSIPKDIGKHLPIVGRRRPINLINILHAIENHTSWQLIPGTITFDQEGNYKRAMFRKVIEIDNNNN